MPVPNPEYNPNWKDVHELNYQEMKRWEVITAEHRSRSDYGPSFMEANEKVKHHLKAMLDSHRMQFPTIQEHAQWVFETFRPDVYSGEKMAVYIPDFEDFKSHEDIDAAYKQVSEDAERAYALKHYSLPAGNPEGVDAFKDGQEENVFSTWRTFEEDGPFESYVSTLVTAQKLGNDFHFCFMHDPNHKGLSVMNGIETLASAVYHETLQNLRGQHEGRKESNGGWAVVGVLKELIQGAASDAKTPKPENFHFYVHVPPIDSGFGKEAFIRVGMNFSGDRFHSPSWDHLKSVPQLVKSASERAMKLMVATERPLIGLDQETGPT